MKAVQPHHVKEQFNQDKLRLLAVSSFVLAMGTALLTYIESSFLEERLGENSFGYVFMASYLVTLISLYHLAFFVNRFGKLAVVLVLFMIELTALLFLAFFSTPSIVIVGFIFFIVSLTLLWVMLDMFVETYSSDQATGKIRGRQLTIMNAGWVIMPAFAGFLADTYGYEKMFLLAAALLVPLIVLFRLEFNHTPNHMKPPPNFFGTLRDVLNHQSLSNIFVIAFLLQFFYAWMVIYTPMHLRDLGFEWMEIGKIFSVMLLPFVLVAYPAGWVADKWLGEKELLTTGLLIAGGATLAIFFYPPVTIGGWMGILFLTRIGAALIEVMRDTYFFKRIDYRDVHLIDFFRNTAPLAYMTAPFIATIILTFYPIPTLFLVLGVIVLSGVIFSLRMVDTK